MGLYKKASAYKPAKRKTLAEKTTRELEKVLDRVFSEFIRLRDADDNGWVRCITCGNAHIWNSGKMHCGHYINRDVKATRYNEINNNGQCESCNSFHSGKIHLYRWRLVQKYSEEEVENLEHIARLGGSYDRCWLQQKIIEYREKVRLLKREKGL